MTGRFYVTTNIVTGINNSENRMDWKNKIHCNIVIPLLYLAFLMHDLAQLLIAESEIEHDGSFSETIFMHNIQFVQHFTMDVQVCIVRCFLLSF
jgi:hypothetical protein